MGSSDLSENELRDRLESLPGVDWIRVYAGRPATVLVCYQGKQTVHPGPTIPDALEQAYKTVSRRP
jgi:hypothetical protein